MVGNAHLILLFAMVELMASLTPGPAVLTVAGKALGGSVRGVAGSILGINLGNVIWYGLAALGLLTLMAAAPLAFTIMRWVGIAYLLVLGLREWLPHRTASLTLRARRGSFVEGMTSAMAVQLSNPKALLFFTVLLPPFIDVHRNIPAQVLLLGGIGTFIEALVLSAYAMMALRISRISLSGQTQIWIGRATGAMLICAALTIASGSLG